MDAALYWILSPGLTTSETGRRWRSPIIGLLAGRCCLISRKIEQVIPTEQRLHNYFNLAAKWLSGTLSPVPPAQLPSGQTEKMLRALAGLGLQGPVVRGLLLDRLELPAEMYRQHSD